jgi:hypothetical protein
MNRTGIVIPAIAFLGATALSSQAIAQQGTLQQQLVGTWNLVSCDYKAPFCSSNATGSVSFSGNGRYTQVVLGGDRPRITIGAQDRTAVTPDHYKAIGQGTVAHFGTWSVNEAEKTLTQHIENSFFGGQGRDFKHSVSLNGDELKLVASSGNNDPRDLGSTATWKKAPNPPQTLRQQLVGTWSLVSCDRADQPACANPSGNMSFGGNGRFTAFVVPKSRPKVASLAASGPGGRANVTPEDYKAVTLGVVAGTGTWSVNEADKTIIYRVEDTLLANGAGIELKGTIVSLTGDDMKDSGPTFGNATWHRSR